MIRLLIFAILTAFAIAACQGDYPAVNPTRSSSSGLTDCRMIRHELGETEVCGQLQRIVALGPYVLESLLALGVQPTGFADDMMLHQGDYDDPSQQIPYLGRQITQPLANVGLSSSPSIEAMLKIQPDLILGTGSNASQYEAFSNMAPTLLLKWADPEASLRTIAQAVERSDQVKPLLAATKRRIASARAAFAPLVASHPKLLLLSSGQLQEINLGNAAHGLCSSLIESLGFQLVAPPGFDSSEASSLVPISLETLPQLNDADSIILLGSNFSELKQFKGAGDFEEHQLANLKQAWQKNAIAQSLRASKYGRVYFIPAYLCLGLPGSIGTELYLKELQDQLLTDL
ncbi:MAG TPA: iron-siderophore ABC transporter substrate-binding protein [Coleofasciculaceae cyanobacterium]